MAVVYQITNLVNGRRYIGITRFTVEHRWSQHKIKAKRGLTKTWLHQAIRKHGPDNFIVEAVACCLRDWSSVEKDVIRSFKPEYNMTNGGQITEGRWSTDKVINRDKQRAAASISSRMRVWSDESRAKLSAATMGRKYSQDIISRMAATKMKKVECVEMATVFDSVSDAGEMLGIHLSTVSKACVGKLKTAHGLHFNFV